MGHHAFKLSWFALLASILFAVPADAKTGSVRVVFAKAGLVGGGGIGHGVLTFEGRRYPFRVYGLSVGVTIGASVNRLIGEASYLNQASDFAGSYSSVGVGGALAGGAGGVQLKSDKGVIVTLHGVRAGLEFAANLSEIRISLQ